MRLWASLGLLCLLLALLHPTEAQGQSGPSPEVDYYAVLGLTESASEREIKTSFRKLSLKYHPDKGGGEDAVQKFLEIQEAYEILSDPEKKHIYDTLGKAGLERDAELQERGGGNGGGGGLFGQFFGGGGGRGGGRKGPDYRLKLSVSLEELYSGAEKTIKITRPVICRSCKGTGAKDGHQHACSTCKGRGHVHGLQQLGPGFTVQVQQPCPKCRGKGMIPEAVCPICSGKRVKPEEKELIAVIEKGMDTGHELRFERASEQSPDIPVPGDVVMVLETQPHRIFRRSGRDLHTEATISLKQALLGFRHRIRHLDGRTVTLDRVNRVTPPGHVQTVEGEGMPDHNFASSKGDLHVRFQVKFPRRITPAQREILQSILGEEDRS